MCHLVLQVESLNSFHFFFRPLAFASKKLQRFPSDLLVKQLFLRTMCIRENAACRNLSKHCTSLHMYGCNGLSHSLSTWGGRGAVGERVCLLTFLKSKKADCGVLMNWERPDILVDFLTVPDEIGKPSNGAHVCTQIFCLFVCLIQADAHRFGSTLKRCVAFPPSHVQTWAHTCAHSRGGVCGM